MQTRFVLKYHRSIKELFPNLEHPIERHPLAYRLETMDSPIKNIDELLSGMLDGMLTEAESFDLEREMEKNPSLRGHLDVLANLKRSLSSGRARVLLRPDFASLVTLTAQKRASEMGEKAPDWLASSRQFQEIQTPKSQIAFPLRRWIYAGALSLAATLLIVFLSIPKSDRQGIVDIPGIPGIPDIASTQGTMAEASIVEPQLGAKELLDGKAQSDLLVASDDKVPVRENMPIESIVSIPLPEANAQVVKESFNQLVDADIKKEDTTPVDPAVKPKAASPSKQKAFLLLVLDVSIDPQAVENRTLERILEKYNIVYTDDLVVNDEQLRLLEESQVVGNVENVKRLVENSNIRESNIRDAIDIKTAEKVADTEEKMGVMFLRSTAKKLDLAMRDIINQFEDFPEFTLNFAADDSAKMLVAQLSSIQVADGSSGFASRLSLKSDRGNNSPFASAAKQGKPMSKVSREKYKGGMNLALPEQDEMSYSLLLLRPAKK